VVERQTASLFWLSLSRYAMTRARENQHFVGRKAKRSHRDELCAAVARLGSIAIAIVVGALAPSFAHANPTHLGEHELSAKQLDEDCGNRCDARTVGSNPAMNDTGLGGAAYNPFALSLSTVTNAAPDPRAPTEAEPDTFSLTASLLSALGAFGALIALFRRLWLS
jgi:hypothetical protein